MAKNVNIELTDEQFEEFREFKEEAGLTWRGLLILGAKELRKNKEARNEKKRGRNSGND